MDIQTHKSINTALCGSPITVSEGFAKVALETSEAMAADDKQLMHGGFAFGLADYAAMLAVNDPNVVLGKAEVKFLKAVRVGESLVAEAQVSGVDGSKHAVEVMVLRGAEPVMKGTFTCFVLEHHVLGA